MATTSTAPLATTASTTITATAATAASEVASLGHDVRCYREVIWRFYSRSNVDVLVAAEKRSILERRRSGQPKEGKRGSGVVVRQGVVDVRRVDFGSSTTLAEGKNGSEMVTIVPSPGRSWPWRS